MQSPLWPNVPEGEVFGEEGEPSHALRSPCKANVIRRRLDGDSVWVQCGRWTSALPWFYTVVHNPVGEPDRWTYICDQRHLLRAPRLVVVSEPPVSQRCAKCDDTNSSMWTEAEGRMSQPGAAALIATPAEFAWSRLHFHGPKILLSAKEARNNASGTLPRCCGGPRRPGVLKPVEMHPSPWRPPAVISFTIERFTSELHEAHGDIEPLWLSVSIWSEAPEHGRVKVCETFYSSAYTAFFNPGGGVKAAPTLKSTGSVLSSSSSSSITSPGVGRRESVTGVVKARVAEFFHSNDKPATTKLDGIFAGGPVEDIEPDTPILPDEPTEPEMSRGDTLEPPSGEATTGTPPGEVSEELCCPIIIHVPPSAWRNGRMVAVCRIYSLLMGSDSSQEAFAKGAKMKKADALKRRMKAKATAQYGWTCRTELGWAVASLSGDDMQTVSIQKFWRSPKTGPLSDAVCLDTHSMQKQSLPIFLDMRLENVHPSMIAPSSRPRMCSLNAIRFAACASLLRPPRAPYQELRHELYVTFDSVSIHRTKLRSSVEFRTLFIKVALRLTDESLAEGDEEGYVLSFGGDSVRIVQSGQTAMTFHQKDPTFTDEVVIQVPDRLPPTAHLLFSVHHMSYKAGCEGESCIAYAALPLLSCDGTLLADSSHHLQLLSCGSEQYEAAVTRNYLPMFRALDPGSCCNSGKPSLLISTRLVSTVHPAQHESSPTLLRFFQWAGLATRPHAVRPPDFLSVAAAVEELSDIVIDEVIYFLPLIASYLLVLLCEEKQGGQHAFRALLELFVRVEESAPGIVGWYCNSLFNNDLLAEGGPFEVWRGILEALSASFACSAMLQLLCRKEVHMFVWQLSLRSFLLQTGTPSDSARVWGTVGKALSDVANSEDTVGMCKGYGVVLADLVGVLPNQAVVHALESILSDRGPSRGAVATCQVFVERVGDPIPMTEELVQLAIKVATEHGDSTSMAIRTNAIAFTSAIIITLCGMSKLTDAQRQHIAKICTPLRVFLIGCWKKIDDFHRQELIAHKHTIDTYIKQVDDIRQLARTTADQVMQGIDFMSSASVDASPSAEFQEDTTTLALTIVAKQTALAESQNDLDKCQRLAATEFRELSVLLLDLIELSEEWGEGSAESPSPEEAVALLDVLPSIAAATSISQRDTDRWARQVADHAAAVCLRCSLQGLRTIVRAGNFKPESIRSLLQFATSLSQSNPSILAKEAAFGVMGAVLKDLRKDCWATAECLPMLSRSLMPQMCSTTSPRVREAAIHVAALLIGRIYRVEDSDGGETVRGVALFESIMSNELFTTPFDALEGFAEALEAAISLTPDESRGTLPPPPVPDLDTFVPLTPCDQPLFEVTYTGVRIEASPPPREEWGLSHLKEALVRLLKLKQGLRVPYPYSTAQHKLEAALSLIHIGSLSKGIHLLLELCEFHRDRDASAEAGLALITAAGIVWKVSECLAADHQASPIPPSVLADVPYHRFVRLSPALQQVPTQAIRRCAAGYGVMSRMTLTEALRWTEEAAELLASAQQRTLASKAYAILADTCGSLHQWTKRACYLDLEMPLLRRETSKEDENPSYFYIMCFTSCDEAIRSDLIKAPCAIKDSVFVQQLVEGYSRELDMPLLQTTPEEHDSLSDSSTQRMGYIFIQPVEPYFTVEDRRQRPHQGLRTFHLNKFMWRPKYQPQSGRRLTVLTTSGYFPGLTCRMVVIDQQEVWVTEAGELAEQLVDLHEAIVDARRQAEIAIAGEGSPPKSVSTARHIVHLFNTVLSAVNMSSEPLRKLRGLQRGDIDDDGGSRECVVSSTIADLRRLTHIIADALTSCAALADSRPASATHTYATMRAQETYEASDMSTLAKHVETAAATWRKAIQVAVE